MNITTSVLTTPLSPVDLGQKPTLLEMHKRDMKRIEEIKKLIAQPNDQNLVNPVPLSQQLAT